MQPHRNAGTELAPRRATAPPPAGNVHGLGVVDALRIDLQPAQPPWLAPEIDDILRYSLEDELTHRRARYDELTEAAKEKHRWPTAREASRSSSAAPTSSRPWR